MDEPWDDFSLLFFTIERLKNKVKLRPLKMMNVGKNEYFE